jgi:hypothetical protein
MTVRRNTLLVSILLGLATRLPAAGLTCAIEGTVSSEGQKMADVTVYRREQNVTPLGKSDGGGMFAFREITVPQVVTLYFEKPGYERGTKIVSDVKACTQLTGLQVDLTPDAARKGPLPTVSATRSVYGRTLYVAPYVLDPPGSAEEADVNRNFAKALDYRIKAFVSQLTVPLPEISIESIEQTVSSSNGEQVRRLGATLNALGMVSGLGELRANPGNPSTIVLRSDFRVIPMHAAYREYQVQLDDSVPATRFAPLSVSDKLSSRWGERAVIALVVRQLADAQPQSSPAVLADVRKELLALRRTMAADNPFVPEVDGLLSYVESQK